MFLNGSPDVTEGADKLIAVFGILCWASISLSLPVAILVGFAGRSNIINACMNCGFKWAPSKKK
ncbi:hypothetical protein EHS13_04380 [Paenibacillus psychroresistens]|uniref:Uncharacterized protein n=1 Tax=Paenibacillus psychroresistens TaxID=1778678 RepID=A0A6B8RTU8_9BACL|nr:hypothetical protein EHS13_04380 [Paenibacillus psychroresistens]